MRRRGLARFTSFVAVAGVATGVASLIFVQALGSGFAGEMREKILKHTAHISVSRADGGQISDFREIAERVRGVQGVRDVRLVSYSNSLLIVGDESSYAVLRASTQYGEVVRGPKEAIFGVRIAEKFGLHEGDTAEIVTLEKREPVRVRVAGFVETGIYEFDSTWIEVSPATYALVHGRDEFLPMSLSIEIDDIYSVDTVASSVSAILGPQYSLLDWREANKPVFAALSLERKAALAVIAIIVLIAALNITTTVAINAAERRRDIAILKTCGATSRKIAAIFVTEGMILGLLGVLGGIITGFASCAATNKFGLLSLPADVYSISQVALRPGMENALLIGLSALVLCFAATLFPALAASRAKPAEILRNA